MMRMTLLIARREYLSYVATWGFWISLAMTPLFLGLGVIVPTLIERAQTTRYFAVVTEEPALIDAIDRQAEDRAAARVRASLIAGAKLRGDADLEREVTAALDAPTPDLARAGSLLGLSEAELGALAGPADRFVRVEPPARSVEAIRPFLRGDQQIDTPEGPRPLYAAAFVGRTETGALTLDFWSEDVSNSDLSGDLSRALSSHLRAEALRASGIDADALATINALRPTVRQLTPDRVEAEARVTLADRAPFIVGFAASIGLWMVIFSVVNMLLTSVIEEKATKVLESLLASARLSDILTGKLLGVGAVSATLMGAWGVLGAFSLAATAAANPAAGAFVSAIASPVVLAPFVLYFVLGYLMYGAIFLAIGSLCETLQEAQTLMSPMILIMMAPLIGIVMAAQDPESSVVVAMSWIPIYTPFIMMARLPTEPALWEILATSVLLAGTTAVILWAAGGVFRAGVLSGASADSIRRSAGAPLRWLARRMGAEKGRGARGPVRADPQESSDTSA